MKLSVNENGTIEATELYNPIVIPARNGNRLVISHRDDTIEIKVINTELNETISDYVLNPNGRLDRLAPEIDVSDLFKQTGATNPFDDYPVTQDYFYGKAEDQEDYYVEDEDMSDEEWDEITRGRE
jgi:hypothetical protein